MSLRIGELAKRAGLTIRTLRHYDAIGLLSPSERSGGGYRLYGQGDVMRLHTIQALKSFGCSLAEIGEVLTRGQVALPEILSRQMEALGVQARRAGELRERLSRLRERMLQNEATGLGDWLETLGMMHLYRLYFSEEELSRLRRGQGRDAWRELAGRVRRAVAEGLAPDAPEAGELAREVLAQAALTSGGDPVLLGKLRSVLDREERIRAATGFSAETLAWVDAAVAAFRQRGQAHAPAGTALGVATLRAAHQVLDDPLVFVDPLALVGSRREAAIRNDPARFAAGPLPGLRASVVVRSRLAEDAWGEARAQGVGQYVILGAGFDTFAYRTPDRESRIFEVDHPGTQAEKRRRLAEAGIAAPENLVYVPVDFTRQTLAGALAAAGFDRGAPAFFSWLGVTMYLVEATVFETLGVIAGMAPGTEIVFDYPVAERFLSPGERQALSGVMARAAAQGEPWRSSFAPESLGRRLAALGFTRIEDMDARQLTERYLAGRSDGLRKSGLTRVVRAAAGVFV